MSLPEPFREHGINWPGTLSHLDERGFALIPAVLAQTACEEIAAVYADDRKFRSRIDMERYAFGKSINILLIHYPRLFSNSGVPFILVSRPWQTSGLLDWGARGGGILGRLGSLSSNVTGGVKSDPHL